MPFKIVRDNIVHMKTDAIVNAANEMLKAGGGVCGSIFMSAGFDDMEKACNEIKHCETGNAVITPGFMLSAKYVIHVVGPVWRDGKHNEEELLRSCYRSAFELASQYKLRSISFPLISSGIYGYPKEKALEIAISEITKYIMTEEIDVYLVIYDKVSFKLSESLTSSIKDFINDNYVRERESFLSFMRMKSEDCSEDQSYTLDDYVNKEEETFSQALLRIIDKSGKSDSEIYKKANIDRRLFSKIRSNKDYQPSKLTAIALSISLCLSLDETQELIGRAGYTLTHSSKFDLIIEYFISRKKYDIFKINEALFEFDQQTLGT